MIKLGDAPHHPQRQPQTTLGPNAEVPHPNEALRSKKRPGPCTPPSDSAPSLRLGPEDAGRQPEPEGAGKGRLLVGETHPRKTQRHTAQRTRRPPARRHKPGARRVRNAREAPGGEGTKDTHRAGRENHAKDPSKTRNAPTTHHRILQVLPLEAAPAPGQCYAFPDYVRTSCSRLHTGTGTGFRHRKRHCTYKSRQWRKLGKQASRLRAKSANKQLNWERHTAQDISTANNVVGLENLELKSMTASAKGTVSVPGSRRKRGLNEKPARPAAPRHRPARREGRNLDCRRQPEEHFHPVPPVQGEGQGEQERRRVQVHTVRVRDPRRRKCGTQHPNPRNERPGGVRQDQGRRGPVSRERSSLQARAAPGPRGGGLRHASPKGGWPGSPGRWTRRSAWMTRRNHRQVIDISPYISPSQKR